MNSVNRSMGKLAMGQWTGALLLALCGCGAQAPNVRVDQDQRIKLSAYHSFGWYQAPASNVAAKPLDEASAQTDAAKKPDESKPAVPLSLTDDRLRSAITSVLQAKGYVLNLESADVRVNVFLNVTERPKQSGLSLGVGAGGSSGNVGGGVGFSIPVGKRHESVAVMTIDVIDSVRNTQVWTGTFQRVIKKAEIDTTEIVSMVDTILNRYPAKQ
jgi:Domain of unknown function (DUF4136)